MYNLTSSFFRYFISVTTSDLSLRCRVLCAGYFIAVLFIVIVQSANDCLISEYKVIYLAATAELQKRASAWLRISLHEFVQMPAPPDEMLVIFDI